MTWISDETVKHFNTPEKNISKDVADAFFKLEKDLVRRMIIEKGIRSDGRNPMR